MTWLDIVVIAVLALSTLLSLFRGVVKEVISLAVWVLSFWLAFRYSYPVSSTLEGAVPYESVRMGTAFLLIFLVVLVAGMLFGSLVSRLVRAGGLGFADRFIGALFGALRGVVVVAVLVMMAALTPLAQNAAWQQSRLIGYFTILSDWAWDGLGGVADGIVQSIPRAADEFADGG
ncbi:MAG: CvpA family protein [Gammaproteobacteria bacterium]|nr:CvpA family protein [Gammaproteobacteria bacterium]